MLVLTARITGPVSHPSHTLTLAYEVRQKARFKTRSDSGEEVGVMLPRGLVLRGGDCLQSEDGEVIVRVIAVAEAVSVASSEDRLLLARASYHLGNRHMPLQIGESYLVYQKDHVLDQMVSHLGLSISHEMRSFEPESGAYLQQAHSHAHADRHAH